MKLRILPHRYPILLVDRILEIEKGRRVVGLKNITVNDFYCHQEYLNGDTIYPGSLQVEAMAQVAGIIILDMLEERPMICRYLLPLTGPGFER